MMQIRERIIKKKGEHSPLLLTALAHQTIRPLCRQIEMFCPGAQTRERANDDDGRQWRQFDALSMATQHTKQAYKQGPAQGSSTAEQTDTVETRAKHKQFQLEQTEWKRQV